jgi:hypothetical protein
MTSLEVKTGLPELTPLRRYLSRRAALLDIFETVWRGRFWENARPLEAHGRYQARNRDSNRAADVGCHAPPLGASGCHARSVERRQRLDSDTARLAAQISRLQQHHPVVIVQLAIPVEKRAYLQRRDVPQSRILGPRRDISD